MAEDKLQTSHNVCINRDVLRQYYTVCGANACCATVDQDMGAVAADMCRSNFGLRVCTPVKAIALAECSRRLSYGQFSPRT